MAIRADSKSIDFTFDFEDSSGAILSFSLRYYYTEEYGATLAVLDDNKEPVINFPIGMFTEVSSFLAEQGLVENGRLPIPQMPQKIMKPNASPKVALPKPRVVSSKPSGKPIVAAGPKVFKDVNQIDMTDDSPEETPFIPPDLEKAEKEKLDAISSSVEGSVARHSLSVPAQQEELSEEELQEIMESRQAAAAKRASGEVKPTVRRK